MNDCIIKKIENTDEIQGKAFVHSKAWQETYCGLIDKNYLDKMTFEKCLEIAHKNKDNTLVAKVNGKVIGFVGYGAYRDEAIEECAEIYGIYVLKEYHNKKIGYRLMNTVLKELSKYRKIVLWVLKNNDRAICFYKKYGFVFDGLEKDVILGTPNTELRMIYQANSKM